MILSESYLFIINLILISYLELFILKSYSYTSGITTNTVHWLYAVGSFVISDFVAYIVHYYFHKNKVMYRLIHSVHHRNKNPNFLTTLNMHPLEMITFYIVYKLPLYLGVPFTLVTYLTYETTLIVWTFLDHGVNLYIFKAHNRHHLLFNGNYATCLTMWDHIFDTNLPQA